MTLAAAARAGQLGQFQQGRPVALVQPVYVGQPQLERFRDLIAPAGPELMARRA